MTKRTWAKCQKSVQLISLEQKKITDKSHVLLSEEGLRKTNELENEKESTFNQKIFKVKTQVLVGNKIKSYEILFVHCDKAIT